VIPRKVLVAVVGGGILLISLSLYLARDALAITSLERTASRLDYPVAFVLARDDRLFYAEFTTGQIRVIADGEVIPSPFYVFEDMVRTNQSHQGLLGLALHPEFPSIPWLYAYYTYRDSTDNNLYNRIARIRADGSTGEGKTVIMDRIPAGRYQNGGVLAFGPDDKLFALVGDVEIPSTAQNLTTLAGKVLRMNGDGTVPEDNPFVGDTTANPFIFTYGHRNMFGLTFNRATGNAYVTENGPECNDEVNLLIVGRNYGWGASGTCADSRGPPLNTNQDGASAVLPMAWYTPTIAPTNLQVLDSPHFREWRGDLVIGDYLTGSLRRLDLGPPRYDIVLGEEVIARIPSSILDVEVGYDGAIWFSTFDAIYRFDRGFPVIIVISGASALVVGEWYLVYRKIRRRIIV